jgi:PadR family transcriptional regulator, regulatory protein PadR
MKRTSALTKVAVALMQRPDQRHWGYELGKEAGLRSGILYPILRRLLEEGWLADGWEAPSDAVGRPPRRYYRLTDTGRGELAAIAASQPRPIVVTTPRLAL